MRSENVTKKAAGTQPASSGGVSWRIPTTLRHALVTVAAGRHHTLIIGPQRDVSLWLARRIPRLLPAPTREEARRIRTHHRAAGVKWGSCGRPVREADGYLPLGRYAPRPEDDSAWLGELGLAAHGVLLLADLQRSSPPPLERIASVIDLVRLTGFSRLSGAASRATPQIVATMTTSRCGRLGDPHVECRCGNESIADHSRRIPASFRSLFDVTMAVPFLDPEAKQHDHVDTLAADRELVDAAWRHQERDTSLSASMRLSGDALACVESYVGPPGGWGAFIGARLIRVAASIADLSGENEIHDVDVRTAALLVLPMTTFVERGDGN
jgi:predicted ATPase with chaperone activity